MKCRCSLPSKDVAAPCDTIYSLHHTHTPQLRRRHLKDTDGKIEAVSLHSPSNTTPNGQYLRYSLFRKPLTPADHAAQSEVRSLFQTTTHTPVSTPSRHFFFFLFLSRTNKKTAIKSCLFPARERRRKKPSCPRQELALLFFFSSPSLPAHSCR